MVKLDPEQQDELLEIMDMPGWKVLTERCFPLLLQQEAEKHLALRVDNEQSITRLVHAQAAYNGKCDILNVLKQLKQSIRNKRP
jgi:hypothetical protein